MNVNDIVETFVKIQQAMTSQRNVITQLQKDVAANKKELAELQAKIDNISTLSEEEIEDEDDIEVVNS